MLAFHHPLLQLGYHRSGCLIDQVFRQDHAGRAAEQPYSMSGET